MILNSSRHGDSNSKKPLAVSALIDDHPDNMLDPAKKQHDIEHQHQHQHDLLLQHELEHQDTALINECEGGPSSSSSNTNSNAAAAAAANSPPHHQQHRNTSNNGSVVTASCTNVIEICHDAEETCRLPDACESKQCETHIGQMEESCQEPEHHHHHHFHLHQLSKKKMKRRNNANNDDDDNASDCSSYKLGKKYRKRIAVALLEAGIGKKPPNNPQN
jgi:hypothetical protein